MSVTLGSFSSNAVLYSCSFQLQRELQPRVALTGAGGHLGFVPRGRAPQITITIEEPALQGSPYHAAAGIDPYKLAEAATVLAFSIQFGSTQYNRWRLGFAQAQVIDARPTVVNGVACVEIDIAAHTSTPVAGDDISIVFD